MKRMKRWLAFFPGKEKSHPKNKKQQPAQKKEAPQQSSPEEACKIIELGRAEDAVFVPQPLMSFVCLYHAIKTRQHISMSVKEVKLLQLKNPLTNEPVAKVFAVKRKKGYVWAKIGTYPVYFSKNAAFIYEATDTFEMALCPTKSGDSLIAECLYDQGEITVKALTVNNETIKTYDEPCDLETAANYALKLAASL